MRAADASRTSWSVPAGRPQSAPTPSPALCPSGGRQTAVLISNHPPHRYRESYDCFAGPSRRQINDCSTFPPAALTDELTARKVAPPWRPWRRELPATIFGGRAARGRPRELSRRKATGESDAAGFARWLQMGNVNDGQKLTQQRRRWKAEAFSCW